MTKYNENDVLMMLDPRNDKEVLRRNMTLMVISLYFRQTEDERRIRGTIYKNDMGFNAYDASYLTKLARKSLSTNPISLIPDDELQKLWERLGKYKKQIAMVLNHADRENEAEKRRMSLNEGAKKPDWVKKLEKDVRNGRIQNLPKPKVIPSKKKDSKIPKIEYD